MKCPPVPIKLISMRIFRIVVPLVATWSCLVCGFAEEPASEKTAAEKIGADAPLLVLPPVSVAKFYDKITVTLQGRIDYGGLNPTADHTQYQDSLNSYIRHFRLGAQGTCYFKDLFYDVALEGDYTDKAPNHTAYQSNAPNDDIDVPVTVSEAFMKYKVNSALEIRFGKAKLPYSRVYLTSSSLQLIMDRPLFTTDLRDYFHRYVHTGVQVSGGVYGDNFRYYLSVSDGFKSGDSIGDTATQVSNLTVSSAGPLGVARIEASPSGWHEDKRSDAHLGEGRHLTLGVNDGYQGAIRYNEVDGEETRNLLGADISFHDESLTLQAEYDVWKNHTTATDQIDAAGFYVQGGWFCKTINVEPVLRYEIFEENKNLPDSTTIVITPGVNWYVSGHDLKFSFNWSRYLYSPDSAGGYGSSLSRNVFELGVQLKRSF